MSGALVGHLELSVSLASPARCSHLIFSVREPVFQEIPVESAELCPRGFCFFFFGFGVF